MPRKFPTEFRDDVVRVARERDAGTSIASVARDFGVSETCLYKWLEKAEKQESAGSDDTAELRKIKKRVKILEQENEILRRAAAFFAKDLSPK